MTVTVDTSKVVRRFAAVPAAVRGALVRTMTMIGFDLTGYVQQKKLQGQVLHHRSGNLSSHVHPKTEDAGSVIRTQVGIDLNAVPYARIHEYGGVIKHPGGTAYYISPLLGDAVFFVSNSSSLAGKLPRTKPHDITIPERSYLRSSVAEKRDDYLRQIDSSIGQGLKS